MQLSNGSMMSVPRRVVRTIDYWQRSVEEESAGFWLLGVAVGTPGAINLMVGRHIDQDWG